MAELTHFCTVDAFNNNVSGFYDSETFLSVAATSSSNAIENDILIKFPAMGLATGDTITAVVFYYYCTANNDGSMVAAYRWYADWNNVWGTLDATDPPISNIASGTTDEGADSSVNITVNSWNSHSFGSVSGMPKNAEFNVGITAELADIGPANMDMDAIENTNARSPYPAGSGQTDGRVFLLVTYTPAASSTWPGYVAQQGWF